MTALLTVEQLRIEAQSNGHVFAPVDGVSLQLNAGETLGLVGESGSGKTLTALSVLRLLPSGARIAGGQIVFDGRQLTELSEAGLRELRGGEVGVIFQDALSALNPTMTIGTQVAEALVLHRGGKAKDHGAKVVEVLRRVGIPEPDRRVDAYPHQLSGGLRQRAMMAIALANEPRFLIADEPTTSLDVSIQRQFLDLLDDLKSRLSMAVLLITHDLGIVAEHSDRVAVMYAGKIVETAEAAELFARPRHPYTRALLESHPDRALFDGGRLASLPGTPPDMTSPGAGCRFAARCPAATARCRLSEPKLIPEESGHRFACFNPGFRERPAHPEPRANPELAAARAGNARTDGAEASGQSVLSVVGLTKEFSLAAGLSLRPKAGKVSALSNVSLDLSAGEALGLVGESGCGKSTLGRILAGLEPASSGRVKFDGQTLEKLGRASMRRFRREVQIMFQDPLSALDPRKRVATSLEEPLVIQRMGSRHQRLHRVAELLELVGLGTNVLERHPHELSGGQRQRINLARALAVRPRILIADEPLSSLDMPIQAQILNLLRDLHQQLGLTYLFISHDLRAVRYLCDRVAVLYLGKLVEIGPRNAIYLRPAHPYTKGLLDSLPLADPRIEAGRERMPIRGELPSASNPPSGCRFRTRCPRAQDICAVEEPPVNQFDHPGHLAACHFPLRSPTQQLNPAEEASPAERVAR